MIKKLITNFFSRRKDFSILFPVSILTLAVASVISFFFLDEYIFSSLRNNPININNFLKAFVQLGKTFVPLWLLMLWFYSTSRLRATLIVLLALLLVLPFVHSIKWTFRRPRPRDIIRQDWTEENRRNPFQSWSFPSGDTASAFAMASVLAAFVSWYWIPVLFIASAVVGFLRIASFAHYLSDVLAGAAIGIFCAWLAVKIAHRYLSHDLTRFGWCRKAALGCLFLIPLLIRLFQGSEQLLIFMKTYILPSVLVFLIVKLKNPNDKTHEIHNA